jgi:N-acetyl-beta-hexosaminidase
VVQWWDDADRALAALKAGHPLISSWKESSYLDYPETLGDGTRAYWMPFLPVTKTADHPLWPPGTPEDLKPLVLGVEAGLWTERAPEARVGLKLFPRLAVLSDLAWTGSPGGAPGWDRRLAAHRERLTAWGVGMPLAVR